MENITQGQWFRGPSADLGEEITQSLRFNSNGYLRRNQVTPNLSGDRTFTFSTWFKHGDMGETQIFGIHPNGSNDNWLLAWTSGASYDTFLGRDTSQSWVKYNTTRRYRDPNAWYHLFLTCSSGVLTLYVNGVQGNQTMTQNHSMDREFWIGSEQGGSTAMDGYLAETYFIQGTVLDAVDDGFIRLNEDGVYVPDTPTISSYGTNGFYLKYDPDGVAGGTGDGAGIGADHSGNGNHFSPSGFNTTAISSTNRLSDVDFLDTPTSNHALFNRLWPLSTTIKGADMELTTAQTITGQASFRFPVGTTGKYWVEAGTASYSATNNSPAILLTSELDTAPPSGTSWSTTANYSGIGGHSGDFYTNFNSTTANSYTEGSGQVALGINFDDQEVLMYNNSTLVNTDTTVDFTKELAIVITQPDSTYNTYDPYINAGQQTHIQSPPTGYTALQTNNLPEPTIKNGKDHFESLLYTGNGVDSHAITGLDFQPDLVWIKPRSVTDNHRLIDSVRGVSTHSVPNSSDAEPTTNPQILESFDSGGFTLNGTDAGWNGNTSTYVAWCWKAGGTAVSNSDGSITSSVSANNTAGFSIVSWTGTGANATVGHELDSAPEFVIVKNRDSGFNWVVGTTALDDFDTGFYLNTSAAKETSGSGFFNGTPPTSSVLHVGSSGNTNGSTHNMVAYCWTPVEGYSKFGEFTGNGSSDGPFVYTGFTPAWILFKRDAAANWRIYDTARNPSNMATQILWPNLTDSEGTEPYSTGGGVDILSNGFRVRDSGTTINNSGTSIYYWAFAEHPFGGANTPPATAR